MNTDNNDNNDPPDDDNHLNKTTPDNNNVDTTAPLIESFNTVCLSYLDMEWNHTYKYCL